MPFEGSEDPASRDGGLFEAWLNSACLLLPPPLYLGFRREVNRMKKYTKPQAAKAGFEAVIKTNA